MIPTTTRTSKSKKVTAKNAIGPTKDEAIHSGGNEKDAAHNLVVSMIAQDSLPLPQIKLHIACTTALGMAMSTWPGIYMKMSYQEVLLTL